MIERELIDDLTSAAYDNTRQDWDVSEYAEDVEQAMYQLLTYCDVVEQGDDTFYDSFWHHDRSRTDTIIEYYISFRVGPGGSASDYCADAAVKAARECGVTLIVSDVDGYLNDVEEGMKRVQVVDAAREFQILADAGISR